LTLLAFSTCLAYSQQSKLRGKVTNDRLEPLSYVTVQIKGEQIGTRTNDKGEYEFQLEEGEYEIVFSLLGYEKQVLKFVHQKGEPAHNVMLKENSSTLNEVKIVNFKKDRAEEIIRNVINRKEKITNAASNYSVNIYIRATQENETTLKEKKKKKKVSITDSAAQAAYNKLLDQMSMSEVSLQLNSAYPNKIKETRLGVKNRGDIEGLFYLTTTDGDFNLYDNLMKIPALAQVPMLSPISYSGLVAYQFKTLNIKKLPNANLYTIHFTPGKLGNALIEGEVQIVDTSWTIVKANYTFPKFHMPEYDYFEVEQEFECIENKSWMPTRQEFSYLTKAGNTKSSGKTIAIYSDYKIDTVFSKKVFSNEVSTTTLEAYEKDTNFWNTIRKEPLSEKEFQFITRKDSIYRATHSKTYLDSIDRIENKITWKKILFFGITNYNREKERNLYFAPAISIFRPLMPGGSRFGYSFGYGKVSKAKKRVNISLDGSYGLRNNDLIGDFKIFRLYNPFSQGYYSIDGGRGFDFIFLGDAFINLLRRSNFYRKDYIEVEHGVELFNGLILRNRFEFANRQSIADLKLNTAADSLFKESTFFNQPVVFDPYNAFFASITLEYTPFQKYIREPREKIILGSNFPTIYAKWRKGIPGILGSDINFDYLEFGIKQRLKLGLAGISQYQLFTGDFVNQKDLRYVDFKFISRGNPYLFNNPLRSFQSLDSTFPVFRRFYEGHYLHAFNGSLINKIPLVKKLNILEVAGGSFLILPERNLRYIEGFIGLEKIIRIWNERFKVGYYFVVSYANKYNNPYQFKIGLDQFNKRKNSWY
jgi:hypothetical protein